MEHGEIEERLLEWINALFQSEFVRRHRAAGRIERQVQALADKVNH